MTLASAFRDSWHRHPQVDTRWLVAVSGGPDSVALLRTAACVAADSGARILCGHIDHGLRSDSAADAEWVEHLSASLGIEYCGVRIAMAEGGPAGIEERARTARYSELERMATQWGATSILTGHTADDHAETILHHLFRGTGLRGLAGIPAVRSVGDSLWLWRPLLTVRRHELLEELRQFNQDFRVDSSNSCSDYTRNRIRQELIPWLERELNPRAVDLVLRLSQQADEIQEWLQCQARQLLTDALVSYDPQLVRLRSRSLCGVSPVVVREMFVSLWARAGWPRQAMTRDHWERLVELCAAEGPPAVQMPGDIDVRRRGELLVITSQGERSLAARGSPGSGNST